MSTRNDVAKRAGVSPAVVSYVLNNSNYVSSDKRKAVLKAVEDLGYTPNAFASSLKSGKSREFLLITDDIRSEMFSEITYYMEPIAYKNGYSLTITSINQKQYEKMFSVINTKKYAGIFMFSGLIPLSGKFLEKINCLAEDGIPIVIFKFIEQTGEFNPSISVIKTNIRSVVCKAVDYLIEEKHHKIVDYLGDGNPKDTNETLPFGDGLRINGYLDSLKKHGIEPSSDHIFFLDQYKGSSSSYLNIEGIIETYFNKKKEERPTAFFVNSDTLAAILIRRLSEAGIKIPQELEIIGFGNSISATIVKPGLTTINLPCSSIGISAINMLIDKAEGREVSNEFFELHLVKRESS